MNPTYVDKFLNIRIRCCTQFKLPSFAFGTDGAHGPSVQTLSFGTDGACGLSILDLTTRGDS